MAQVIKRKPTSPGRRFVVSVVDKDLHNGAPYAPLTQSKNRISGRNNRGKITVRHKGGGHKRRYRIIDFRRNKDDITAKVERLEYDPNRSANIALVLYADGERKYIIAPNGLKVGDEIASGSSVAIKAGNVMPCANIPLGSVIHCIELKPGKGAQMARSAGTSAQLIAKEGMYVTLSVLCHCALRVLTQAFQAQLPNA
jgi:large subunit ribosomal protein L2